MRSSATASTHAHTSSTSSSSATLPRPSIARNESTDRKRRLTTAEEGRNYPYVAPGTTRASAIDLSTPPRQQGHQRGHTTGSVTFSALPPRRESIVSQRRASDMVPPWQPDAEVHKCPVCEQEFGFLFRKHHCRKCGRVVCAGCSPHRITIPREYIVQPPGFQDHPLMGGAETVRVCKPCVPDPWTPQAPSQQNPGANARPIPTPSRRSSETSQSRYHRRPSIPVPTMQPQTNDSRFPSYRDFLPSTHASQPNNAPLLGSSSGPRLHHHFQPNDRPARPRGLTAPTNRAQQPVPGSSSSPHTPVPRRRQVKEEDECPVCGIEMPPGDAVREAHIQTCVSSRFSTPPSQPAPASNLGPVPPTNPRDPNLPSSLGASTTPDATANARARAMSYRSRGIFPYIATEKDCMDGDGREQECTICMEEFQAGEEMGRLECLCKFHRKCIRDWWGVKGRGSCPVHVFNE